MATGGSIESVTISGRTYSVAADADVQQDLGGFENEIQPNGDATARLVKARVPWSLADVQVSVDSENGDLEFLNQLRKQNAFFPVSIVEASGSIWQGDGQIMGEVKRSLQNTVVTLTLSGTGELTKQ